MKWAVIGLVLLGLTACQSAEKQMIEDAQAAVAAKLRDPSSAQFRNVRHRVAETGADIVCGEVNGKNGFGGYAGFQRFIYDAGTTTLEDGDDPGFGLRWVNTCF
ncbi:MAG TPA: hypothetical protein DCG71_05325 [Brevundimonas sp.]|nr:hypothetical protein [Brevundimonas sp.]